MKNVLLSLILTLASVNSFATATIAKIELDKAHLVPIDTAALPVNARLVYSPLFPGSSNFKMAIEVDLILEWQGCGRFNDGATIFLNYEHHESTQSKAPSINISFFTLTKTQADTCQGKASDKRVFTFSYFPTESEEINLGKSVKIKLYFKPNPKGKGFLDVFDYAEITQDEGYRIVLGEE